MPGSSDEESNGVADSVYLEFSNSVQRWVVHDLVRESRNEIDIEQLAIDIIIELIDRCKRINLHPSTQHDDVARLCRTICKRRSIDAIRKWKLRKQLLFELRVFSSRENLFQSCVGYSIATELERLREMSKQFDHEDSTILLMRIDGASVDDIAAQLHLSRRTVDRRFSKIMEVLKQQIGMDRNA